jgi:hypothetical protein
MSLNGLDDPKVTEAYTGALGEAGGWYDLAAHCAPWKRQR